MADSNARGAGSNRGRRMVRWLRGVYGRPEWVTVWLIAASAALSSVAVWQATSLSDQATDLANQARHAAARQTQWQSALQTQIAHDQEVLVDCDSATARRNKALTEYSKVFDPSLLGTLIESEKTRVALGSLLLTDSIGDCQGYDLDRGLEWASAAHPYDVGSDPQSLSQRSAELAAGEPVALGSAVLFAVALLLLTFADSARGRRWTWRWIVASGIVLVVATVLAVVAFSIGSGTLRPVVLVPLVPIGLWLTAWWVRRMVVMDRFVGADAPQTRVSSWVISLPPVFRREVRSWAQLLGGATLVLFTLSLFWLNESADHERQALVDADRFTLEASQAQGLGEQSALATLGYVAQLSELDASLAATRQPAQGGTMIAAAPDTSARDAVLARWTVERKGWISLANATDAMGTDGSHCLRGAEALAWAQVDAGASSPLPVALMDRQRTDPDVLVHFLGRSLQAATACEIRAELRSRDSQDWEERRSLFTVALVLLGLAGFLFALAADPDRSLGPRRWLLAVASLGLVGGVAFITVGLGRMPPLISDDTAATGSRAYAEATAAIGANDCVTARDAAASAVAALDSFALAHALDAQAWACDERSWLLAPSMVGDRLDRYRRGLQRAVDDKARDVASLGGLGWAKVLTGLSGSNATANLTDGLDLTERALRSDGTNTFLCFNRAFTLSALGDDASASTRYKEAIDALRAGTTSDKAAAPCDPGYQNPVLQDWVILSALADVELLPETKAIDGIRSELLFGLTAPTGAASQADVDRLAIKTYPQGLALVSRSADVHGSMSIVWYYRPPGDGPWGVLVAPSLSTMRPGSHAELLWSLGRALPPGEYRGDVYVDGVRLRTLTTSTDWWTEHSLAATNFARVDLPDLGLAAVVPTDWRILQRVPGAETWLGGNGWNLAFERTDGDGRDELGTRLSSFVGRMTKTWGVDWDTKATVPTDTPDYFMAMQQHAIQSGGSGRLAGIGHVQYLLAPEKGVLPGNVADASCPGTAVMAAVEASDPAIASGIWTSLSLRNPAPTVRAEDVAFASPFSSPTFSIGFPTGWTTVGCPSRFSAVSPDGAENVIASTEPYTGSLDEYVSANLTNLRVATDFPGFVLEEQVPVVLANGVRGERVRFTWTAKGNVAVRQTQVYAVARGLGYVMTYTTRQDLAHDRPSLQTLLGSFTPRLASSLVPAVCASCDDGQRAVRQASIDLLSTTLSVVKVGCTDATDSRTGGATAVVNCNLPGGFRVDFALWPNRDAMNAHSDPFRALAGAVTKDWYLKDSGDLTGITVEFLSGGDAGFYWTYNDLLITGNAALAGGDQTRLNNWWQTSGALLKE